IDAHSPEFSWVVEDPETESRQALELDEAYAWTVTGARPTFRFYHRYETEPGAEGGVVEVRQPGSTEWKRVNGKILRNDYPGILQYGTFAQGNLFAFSGFSGDEFEATYVDLSEWAGEKIVVRFRFGTDANTAGFAWLVDDMEFMDLFAYNGEACITNNQGFSACDTPEEEGTIVESQIASGTEEKQLESLNVALFPNPASDYLHLVLGSERQQDVNVSLLTLDGKQVHSQVANVFGNEVLSVNVNSLSAGLYFVKISTEEGVLVRKVIIE
ncbi:MAG: T9SS type A sorting domain-containing protein, partial [Bacteroidota bacterium]